METTLADHLFDLGARYAKAMRLEEATVGRLCAADGRFFARLREGKTFTARKYDDIVRWFSLNWPREAEWPDNIERPDIVEVAE